jgi:hypothetical protein
LTKVQTEVFKLEELKSSDLRVEAGGGAAVVKVWSDETA